MVSTRSFNLEPLAALHLDHIVNSPEQQSKGCLATTTSDGLQAARWGTLRFGATLLQGLVQRAAMSKKAHNSEESGHSYEETSLS